MSAVEDINNGNSSTQVLAQNDVNLSVNSFSYTWTLNNFSEFMKFPSARLHSPCFIFKGSKWNLYIQSECKNEEPQLIRVRLMRTDKKGPNYFIQYKYTLVDSKGSTLTKEASSVITADKILSHRLSFQIDEIKRELASVTEDDRLTIVCELLVLSAIDDKDPKPKEVKVDEEPPAIPKVDDRRRKVLLVYSSKEGLFSPRNEMGVHLVIIACLLLLLFQVLASIDAKTKSLNKREINELIIDSTFQIKNIAEALNLTNVKAKSDELISMFEEKFNIYKEFPRMRDYLPKPSNGEDSFNYTLLGPLFNLVNNIQDSNDNQA